MVPCIALPLCAQAQDWPRVEHPTEGVTVIYDDYGAWAGPSMGTSHQVKPDYRVRKHLDLSGVPQAVFNRAQQARLLVYFACQDYSWNIPDVDWNGLDERFEIVVNGTVHEYPTSDVPGAKRRKEDDLHWRWQEFPVGLDELVRGDNVFEFRKAAGDQPPLEDYIYVGIDNTESHGHSEYTEHEEPWRTDKLNTIDATGEYMVRLVLLEHEPTVESTWRPMAQPVPPIGYAQTTGEVTERGLQLRAGQTLTMELDPDAFDPSRDLTVYASATPVVLDAQGAELTLERLEGERPGVTVPAWSDPDVIRFSGPAEGATVIREVGFRYFRPYLASAPPVNMAPTISQPAGGPIRRAAQCQVLPGEVVLHDSLIECRLQTEPNLRMTSLHSQWLRRETLLEPERTHLFVVEIGDQRFGAEDFELRGLVPLQDQEGVTADLLLAEHALNARLTLALAAAGQLRFGLELINEGDAPAQFKLAFPQLGGLALSEDWSEDYYLFPAWGGIIADANTELRTAYGENSAWWQMIDLFSPSLGGGLALRGLDETGLYKCPAMRKGLRLVPEYSVTDIGRYMEPEMYWQSSLDPGPGTALTFEYLRRTREPGQSFAPPDALVEVHPGDWHEAMGRYAEWAHAVWDWRPHPSKLGDRWNIIATGWGQSPLYGEDGYRTDFFQEGRDVLEMMSWWEWSEVGPWHVPMDQLKEQLGEALYERYKSYWVINPATGKLEYPLNRGDYHYNEDWGGLPALRDYIQQHYDRGILPMFYMEGILCCATTDTGEQYGRQYGVMNPLWKDSYNTGQTPEGYVGSYASWNMCSDTRWWPEYLAETVARVCRDTGVGGVRLDEYGHRGYVCTSPHHEHLFAEPGHNAWLQAVSRACRLVHEAMDQVDPELVLTTEFPGYDHLARFLDGCIVYESMSHVRPIRPVPVNLFRFYFPECKVGDLDRGEGDSLDWQLFNAMARFGAPQPPAYYRILHESSDLFEVGERRPLIPTLHERVYANRLSSQSKQITLLYNARGFTVEEPLVAAEPREGWHFMELLRCQELAPVPTDGGQALALKLRDGDVACIAHLPRRLSVEAAGEELRASVTGEVEGLTLALSSADGATLAERPAAAEATISLPADADSPPACLKLLRDGRLIDAAPLP
ncbi:MAG: DUF6259 domain-containing protein [Armatimonadota bacterium]|nr:DUF6259 domain-containing protein [Armatimonadota bacterium]